MALEYIGGGRYLIGIPARDLTDEEIKGLALTEKELIETGLYKKKEVGEVEDLDTSMFRRRRNKGWR